MMLGSFQRRKSTIGANTSGAPRSASAREWPSVSMRSGSPQWAHAVVTTAEIARPRSRPCTKGAAIASTAQAAKISSPPSNRSRCGVAAAVTG